MVSRHGLLPHAHIEQQSTAWVSDVPTGPLTADGIAAFVRGQVDAARVARCRLAQRGRRAAPGRPSPSGCGSTSTSGAGSWLTYVRDWEVRRHRMAPEVADRIRGYRRDGRLDRCHGRRPRATSHLDVRRRGRQLHRAAHRPQPHRPTRCCRRSRPAAWCAPDPLRLGLDSTLGRRGRRRRRPRSCRACTPSARRARARSGSRPRSRRSAPRPPRSPAGRRVALPAAYLRQPRSLA